MLLLLVQWSSGRARDRNSLDRLSPMWGGKGNYEKTGAYKGMVVTHLFQVMAFVAIEPP